MTSCSFALGSGGGQCRGCGGARSAGILKAVTTAFDRIRDLLPSAVLTAAAEETVFWSGAGISADAPTCAPVGTRLVDRALAHALAAGTADVLERYYRLLRLRRRRPRLETVLDVVNRIHGEEVLLDLLNDLEAPPNGLHAFFAAHVRAGGGHVTANFDTCIERASGGKRAPVDVVHFHGSLAGGELGATLARIERGLPPDMRQEVLRALLAPDKRLIVFVGYSGSDFFDVDPFLRALASGSLRGRQVLWVAHREATPALVPPMRRQLDWLRDAGAEVTEIAALTRDVVGVLGDRWGVAPRPRRGTSLEWEPRVAVDEALVERATLELFAVMGLHREVARLAGPRDASEWELVGHTHWARGRYRDAGRAWALARAGAGEAARIERAAAVMWIRGRYRRACRLLVDALRAGEGSFEERLLLAETLARAFDHMSRYSDSRRHASAELRRFLAEHLPDPEELAARGTPVGTHLHARLRSARRAIGVDTVDEEDDDAITSFGEYEALSAQLNYRHGQLRGRRRRGHVDPLEFQLLRRDFAIIGNLDGAARTVLLGGPEAFSGRELVAAVRALDVTLWHRMRLLAAAYARPAGAGSR
jgi:hypothetical protein